MNKKEDFVVIREILFKKIGVPNKIYQGEYGCTSSNGVIYVRYHNGEKYEKILPTEITEVPSIEVSHKIYQAIPVEGGLVGNNSNIVQEVFNRMTDGGWLYNSKLSADLLLFEKDVKELKGVQ